MADEVARLDFATNIAEITAQVARGLQEMQTRLEATGGAANSPLGAGIAQGLSGLEKMTAQAAKLQAGIESALAGTAKLSDFKGAATLGGNFAPMIKQLTEIQDLTAKALSPAQAANPAIQAQLVEPVVAMINQLKEVQRIVQDRIAQMGAEQAAQFQSFLNPGQISRATGVGQSFVDRVGPLTATSTQSLTSEAGFARATTEAAAARQREATAAAAAVEAEAKFAQSEAVYAQLRKDTGVEGIASRFPDTKAISSNLLLAGDTFIKTSASGDKLALSQQELFNAETKYAAILNRDAAAAERAAGGGGYAGGGGAADPRRGSVFDSFLGGAFGHGFDTSQAFDPSLALGNLAATAGVLARYGYEFKLIQGVLGSIKTSFTDLGTYQEGMVTLGEAIASTGASSIDLGNAFSDATTVALNQNDAIAIGTQGLQAYRDELQQGVSANSIFERSVEDVGTAMILSGQDAQTAQKNLIAATNSFQLGSGGGSRINDAVINAVKNYGGNRADVYDALSTAGGAAQEAGLTPEQLANLVALIRSRTGDSGSTIASSINRLVSRQDNAQFRGALGQLGIQDTGQVGPEIIALSKAYNGLTTAQQQSLIVSLGGARALKDLLPVLQDGATLVDANKRSTEGAGAASQAAAAQLATLQGQLKELRAVLTDILTNLGRAGLFSGFGSALAVIKPALEGVNELLSAFDAGIPGLGRGILGIVIDFALLGKTIEVFRSKMAEKSATDTVNTETTAANTETIQANTAAVEQSIAARDASVASSDAQVGALDTESAAVANQTRLLLERNAVLQEGGVAGAAGFWDSPAAIGAEAGLFARGRGAVTGLAERGGIIGATATGVGAAAGLLTNPVTVALGALVVFGGVTDSMHRLDKATQDGTDALNTLATAGKRAGSNTAADLATAAADFKNAAKEAKASGGGVFGSITNLLDGNRAGKTAASDLANAKFASSQSALIGNSLTDISTLASTAFGPETTLAEGLQAMKDRGIDAGTQLQAVNVALGLVKNSANSAANALVDLGVQHPGVTGAPANILSLAQAVAKNSSVSYTVNPGSDSQQFKSLFYEVPDATKIITAQLNKDHIGKGQQISQAEIARIVGALTEDTRSTAPGDVPPATRAIFIAGFTKRLNAAFGQLLGSAVTAASEPLPDSQLQSDLTSLLPVQAQATQDANPLRLGSKQRVLQQNLDQLKLLASKAADPNGDALRQTLIAIRAAEDALAQEKVKNLEALRAAAEAGAGTNVAAIRGIRRDYFAKEIADAGTDEGVLVGIFNQMTQGEINLFRAKYQQEVELAKAALASEEALLNAVDSLPNADDVAGVKLAQAQSRGVIAAQNKYKTALDLLNSFKAAGKNAVPQTSTSADSALAAAQQAHLAEINSTADPRNPLQQAQVALEAAKYQLSIAKPKSADYYNALKAVTDAEYALAQAHVQLSDAIAQARVYPGSKIEAAAAELRTATNEMKLAERGTVDWYKAQGDELKARLDYAAAVQENAHVLRELHGDPTDPVFQAGEALRQAKDQLRSDRANNAPSDVINADREKVKEATEAKQRAAFDQKFQDEKTAFDLQQISATAYINFLDHQRDALQAIHHRTRQQIDELNQIDEAIKAEAGTLDGQFNIGNIKIPTPYEARRYIQATSQGQGYQSTAVTNTTNNLTISGADTQKVKAILKQLLGPPSIGRTSTGTRKT